MVDTLIQVAGRIDETGHLKVDQPFDLPPGDVLVTVEIVTEAMLTTEDALWEAAIARDPQFLDELLAEGLQSMADGTADELNPDDMLP